MRRDDFEVLVAQAKARAPHWFELERVASSERDVADLEAQLGIRLPLAYRDFVTAHGAGLFAFLTVLGPGTGTPWDLTAHRRGLPAEFIPVADLATGDYFGHVVVDGRCQERVSVWDHDGVLASAPDGGNRAAIGPAG